MFAISMIMLAPLMGCARVLKYFRPLMDVLKQIPYATWMVDWLKSWWKGHADFDDLPQTPEELREYLHESPQAERLIAEMADLRTMQETMQKGQLFKGKRINQDKLNNDMRNFKAKLETIHNNGGSESESEEELHLENPKRKDKGQSTFETTDESGYDTDVDTPAKRREKGVKSDNPCKKKEKSVMKRPPTPEEIATISDGIIQSDMLKLVEELMEEGKSDANTTGLKGATEARGRLKHTAGSLSITKKKPLTTHFVEAEGVLNPQSNEEVVRDEPSYWTTFTTWVFGFYVDLITVKDDEADLQLCGSAEKAAEVNANKRLGKIKALQYRTKKFWKQHSRKFLLAVVLLLGFVMAPRQIMSGTTKAEEVPVVNVAQPQAGKRARGVRTKRRHNGKKFINPSGGAERAPEDEFEDDDPDYLASYMWDGYDQERYEDELERRKTTAEDYTQREHIRAEREQERSKFRAGGQTRRRTKNATKQSLPDFEPLKEIGGDALRRKIYASKRRTYRAPTNMANILKEKSIAHFNEQTLYQQAFKPSVLASGVYKFYNEDQYACTATQVSNRLYVVLHALSEDSSRKYKATNYARTLELKGTDFIAINDEIGYFPVPGIPSVWKNKDLRVVEDACIVGVFGFGSGDSEEPDLLTGFASPQGWCNAKTRDGDCTAPVLDEDGKILGFWTHGNRRGFGRFEPITTQYKESLNSDEMVLHSGLGFRSCPLSPQN
nr:MAG: hypothetical protein [Crogonang virus 46]